MNPNKTETISLEMAKPGELDSILNEEKQQLDLFTKVSETLYLGIFDKITPKDCKRLIGTISKWKFQLFNDLDLPVYKINSRQCFLTNIGSNASIKFPNLLIAFHLSIDRRDIASVRRLSGTQGTHSGFNSNDVPKHYYDNYTFSYHEVSNCLIKLLTFSWFELNGNMDDLYSIIAEINKHKRK